MKNGIERSLISSGRSCAAGHKVLVDSAGNAPLRASGGDYQTAAELEAAKGNKEEKKKKRKERKMRSKGAGSAGVGNV